jgi:hypothetical protein
VSLQKVNGVLTLKPIILSESSVVIFDKSEVDVATIENVINKIGYKVKGAKINGSKRVD